MFTNKIDLDGVEYQAAEKAKNAREGLHFIAISTNYQTKKKYGVDQEGLDKMVSQVVGDFMEVAVDYHILKKLLMEHGSKRMIEAFNDCRSKAEGAVKAYYEEMNNVKRTKNKGKVS